MTLPTTCSGPAGHAELVDLTGSPDPRTAVSVAWWLLTCPGQSPAWDQYGLWVMALRDAPGVETAHLDHVGMTHELMVVALDPAEHYTAAACRTKALTGDSVKMLRPGNVRLQFEATDQEMATVAYFCARAVCDGLLPAEPALSGGGNRAWLPSIVKTLAHIRGEAHAE